MARRRSKKTRIHHRRRMGAIGGDTGKLLLGSVGGAVLGRMAASKITTFSPKIMNAIQLIGGALLAIKIAKSPLVKGVGIGLAINGAIGEGQAFGFLSGVEMRPQFNPASNRRLASASNVNVVGDPYYPSPSMVGAFPSLAVVGGMY